MIIISSESDVQQVALETAKELVKELEKVAPDDQQRFVDWLARLAYLSGQLKTEVYDLVKEGREAVKYINKR